VRFFDRSGSIRRCAPLIGAQTAPIADWDNVNYVSRTARELGINRTMSPVELFIKPRLECHGGRIGVASCCSRRRPIIQFVRNVRGRRCIRGASEWAIPRTAHGVTSSAPNSCRRHGEIVAQEHWCSSGFANTDLDLQMKKHGIHQLIIIGLIPHTCIEATVRFVAGFISSL
jgi:hypothetical protein